MNRTDTLNRSVRQNVVRVDLLGLRFGDEELLAVRRADDSVWLLQVLDDSDGLLLARRKKEHE